MKYQNKLFNLHLLLILSLGNIQAQNLSGRIVDAKNSTPIPFVSIVFNEKYHLGTVSNIDGFFTISLSEISKDQLHFSCMSYQDTVIHLNKTHQTMLVCLKKRVLTSKN